MKTITAQELHEWRKIKKPHQLIDIRENYEREYCSLGGESIPMETVLSNVTIIQKDIPVVLHCKSGKRSSAMVFALESKFGFENLYSLEGGILAWIENIEPEMVRY